MFHKGKTNGFTLIEFVMVIVLSGILFAIGGSLLLEGFQASYSGMDILRAERQASLALERMTRELRLILNPNSINISVPNQITFTTIPNETVTYALSNGQLLRNSQPLASGIGTLNFTYYDRDRNVITNAANASLVRYIVINLVVTQNNTNYSFYTGVSPRNLP